MGNSGISGVRYGVKVLWDSMVIHICNINFRKNKKIKKISRQGEMFWFQELVASEAKCVLTVTLHTTCINVLKTVVI